MIYNYLAGIAFLMLCPAFYLLIAISQPHPFKDRNGSKLKQTFAKKSFKSN